MKSLTDEEILDSFSSVNHIDYQSNSRKTSGCKSCGTSEMVLLNMLDDSFQLEHASIKGDFCSSCLNEVECKICGCLTSWAIGGKQCICCRVFCANCFIKAASQPSGNSGTEFLTNSGKLTRVSCCDSIYCGKESYCIAKICGHCNRCKSCFESNEGYVDFKQCATLECKSKICHFCCRSEFVGDLRYCRKCLTANEEFFVLRLAHDLRPGSDAVKAIEESFHNNVLLQSSYTT